MKHSTLSSSPNSGNTIVSRSQFKPILFSKAMVQAILSGDKTQTRRIVKQAKGWDINWKVVPIKEEHLDGVPRYEIRCGTQYHLPWFKAKFNVGDILWVRETWQYVDIADDYTGYVYRATGGLDWEMSNDEWKWKPSIFMPKKACRLFLEVTEIRAERLHDISEADALAEGISFVFKKGLFGDGYMRPDRALTQSSKSCFEYLWNKINKNWNENPFVWVITFKPVECPQGFC
jgi:hypothetical protein